jgi:chromosome segregation ATPase
VQTLATYQPHYTVSKFATKKEHLSREDYIKQQKQKQLKSLFVDIDTQKKELKNIYTEINKQKNEMKKQRDLYKKVDLEYKEFNEQYLQLQALEKQKRQEYKDLENSIKDKKIEVENVENYEKSLKKDIAKIVKEHTKKETPLLGNTFYKVEDRNIMFTKLVNKIQEPLNIQLNEITHLKRENQSLKNENSKEAKNQLTGPSHQHTDDDKTHVYRYSSASRPFNKFLYDSHKSEQKIPKRV